jgi:hypothetical protein
MSIWNHDISAAPRGKSVTIVRTVKGEEKPFAETVIAPVWLATQCGRVIKSYWLEKTKFSPARWAGLGVNEVPVAWQHFVTPEHPFQAKASDDNGATGPSRGGDTPAFILEDCGSGA